MSIPFADFRGGQETVVKNKLILNLLIYGQNKNNNTTYIVPPEQQQKWLLNMAEYVDI